MMMISPPAILRQIDEGSSALSWQGWDVKSEDELETPMVVWVGSNQYAATMNMQRLMRNSGCRDRGGI